VARSQQERLMAATVATCDERGYDAMTVADLVGLSGVSRAAFYEHFANKEECFLATMREILDGRAAPSRRTSTGGARRWGPSSN
jgi:AcrR family transcriptional regulator